MFLLALLCSIAGLVILFVAHEPEQERYILSGTVMKYEHGIAALNTSIPLRVKRVRTGEFVNVTVFWNGEYFVATP